MSIFSIYLNIDIFTLPVVMLSSVMPKYSSTFACVVVIGLSFPNFVLSCLMTSSVTFLSTWDNFKLSTCHLIVNCLLLVVLFATHWSFSFSLNPHSFNVLDRNFQNNSAACNVPYSTFLSFTYDMASLTISSEIDSSNNTWTSCSMF